MRTRGFTFIEVIFAAAISTLICGGVLALSLTGSKIYTTSSNQMKSSTRAHGVMERMLVELRQASISAEDLDNDNDPDDIDVEDVNGNGRIEDDWSLADGASAQSLTVNLALGNGMYSDPITFRFDGSTLWRVQGGESAILANDVTALTFTRQGRRLIVNVVVASGVLAEDATSYDRGGRFLSLVREVLIRN